MSKSLLITGASRGIGRATALLAAAQGWTVGINYRRDRGAADEVLAQIVAAGGKAIAVLAGVARVAAAPCPWRALAHPPSWRASSGDGARGSRITCVKG